MSILNLTQHNTTPEQIEAGVVEPTDGEAVKHYLTFEGLPTQQTLAHHVSRLVSICRYWKSRKIEDLQVATMQSDAIPYTLMEIHSLMRPDVMIGGAPFLMAPLDKALREAGFSPVYAFSLRQSEEKIVDGEVVKTSVFKHQGFIGL